MEDAASDGSAAGTGYRWTQTKGELTLLVRLPAGFGARDVSATASGGALQVSCRGSVLVAGVLHAGIAGSVWSVEKGLLTFELEKARATFWPCALRGDTEVDVAALLEKEKRDLEPAYKPDPNGDSIPQRVTDKETLRKLKAEFPQLELPMGEDVHTATHRNFAGPRKAFEWGALPPAEPAAEAALPAAAKPQPAPAAPALSAPAAAAPSSFSWGVIPADQPAPAEPSQHCASKAEEAAPSREDRYCWGALPTDATPAPPRAVPDAGARASAELAEAGRQLDATTLSSAQARGGVAAPAGGAAGPGRAAAYAADPEEGASSGARGLYTWGPLPIS